MITGHDGVKYWRSIVALIALLLGVAVLASAPSMGLAAMSTPNGGAGVVSKGARDPLTAPVGPIVGRAEHADTSLPLRSIRPVLPDQPNLKNPEENENPLLPGFGRGRGVADTIVQKITNPLAMPTPIANFDGIYNYWGIIPPDTNGDVGPNHYLQSVNLGFAVYSKTGVKLYGPTNTNVLWTGFGGPCQTENAGDPIALYDPLADRWLISQFTAAGPYYQCIAISTSGDPLGSYYRYAFLESATIFGDYPHLGVWPDGYYMTVNQFNGGSGGGNYVFERPRMLNGDPNARFVYFSTPNGGGLPSDLDGHTPPPAGSPDFFLFPQSAGTGQLGEYKFHVDWISPTLSTFAGPTVINVAPWNDVVCNAPQQYCADQPNTTAKLETIGDRFMHRLAYRNMGTYETLVANHTVNITSTVPGIAGVRWYEIRTPNAITPTLYQQGTYTLNDNTHRWMGSIAMDRVGNIAVGYSASSTIVSPSIRYAGRLVTDPLGQLAQGEATMYQGMGVEDYPGTARWGDYSSMTVDPSDDCTFWYTTEYFQQKGDRNWRTRIGSFKFPNCGTPPDQCQINFSDVQPTDWFYDFVRCLYCRGAISGYSDGTFRPYANTTRGQMTKIVVVGFAIPINTTGGPHFSDVPTTNPFYAFIETAYNNNIVSGYADGSFRWGNDVTRGQLSKIVVQAAVIVNHWVLINPATPTFSDVPRTDPFYQYIETAYCHGIISGYSDGTFKPGNNATRAQISKIVCLAVRNEIQCNFVQPTITPSVTPTICPPGPGAINTNGTINSSSLIMTGRLARNGIVSSCASPKNCPGINDTIPRHYAVYTYTNTLATAQCVTVRIDHACGDNHLLSYAYLDNFVPNVICANYLADMGVGNPHMQYSFNVPAGHAAVIVVEEGVANVGCQTFHIDVSPCAEVPTYTPTRTATITQTPTPICSGTTYNVATATATMFAATNDIGNHCDDCNTTINFPFPVNIYDQTYTSARAGSNGTLQFASDQPNISRPNCLPVSQLNPPFAYTILAYYDDLRTDQAADSGIFTNVVGTAPNRQFIVRWKTTYFDQGGEANFEVVLNEGALPQTVSVIYGTTADNGAAASSGILRGPTLFTQFHCNTPAITNGLEVNYLATPITCGTPGTPTNTPTPGAPTNTFTRTATPGGNTPTRTNTPACQATPAWQPGPTYTPGVYGFQGGIPSDGKFYAFGGMLSNNTPIPDSRRFNPTTNLWEAIPNLPVAVGQEAVGAAGTKVYAAGGYLGGTGNTSVTTTLQIFDTATNSWSFGPSMPSRVEAGAGAVLNNKLYVIGGDDSAVGLTTNYIFDIATNTWSSGAPLPEARTNGYATASGGYVWFFGGVDSTFANARDNILRYDPVANTWATLSSANTGGMGNYGAISPYGAGQLFVTDGGTAGFAPSNGTHIYNIATDTWTVGPPMSVAHLGQAQGTLADGRVIVASGLVTGTPQATTNAVELLTPGGCGTATSTPTAGAATNTATRTNTPGASPTVGALLFSWNVEAVTTPPADVSLGVEWALGNFWVTGRNSTDNVKKIYKINNIGQLVASYPQEVCASTTFGYRDLAFDGTNLITADECGIDKIDPATGAVVGHITTPAGVTLVRALAYDPVLAEYYTANFGSAITVFNASGAVIRTLPNPSTPALAFYGLGFDNRSPGGPYLWGWSQNTTTGGTCGATGFCARASRLNPTTGAQTGLEFNGVPVGGAQEVAGGADVADDLGNGRLTLVTLHQAVPDTIRGYDLGVAVAGLQPVQIMDFSFSPASVSVPAGTVVRWTNMGAVAHTATSNTAVWDSGNLNPNDFYQFTFNTPGAYPYHCTVHPAMTGTITVTSAAPFRPLPPVTSPSNTTKSGPNDSATNYGRK